MSSTQDSRDSSATPRRPAFELTASRHFTAWLAEQKASLAFTTYQAGKLFLLGLQPDGRLAVFNRTFERCMGLYASPDRLLMSTLYQLWHFDNALVPGHAHQGHDRLYVPRLAWTTGDLDIHDIAQDGAGRPIFVNTLFSCLATVSDRHSFAPVWQPRFISKLAAEDRCDLNGLAMENGAPRYVTSVSTSDVADGWRDHRAAGASYVVFGSGQGLPAVIDLATDADVVIEGAAGEYSGWSVSGAGDVNGDGIDDLIIGADGADPNGRGASGGSYVVLGFGSSAEAALEDLIAQVEAAGLQGGLENSLTKKLENALKDLAKGKTNGAAGKLGAFINEVGAQSGKKIDAADADAWIAAAQAILDSLGAA